MLGESVALLRGLLAIPLITRLLPPEEYAAYGQALALAALLLPTVTLTTNNAIMRFFPGATAEQQRGWYSAWWVMLVGIGCAVTAMTLSLAATIGSIVIGPRENAGTYVAVACLLLWSGVVQQTINHWFFARGDLGMYSRVVMVQSACLLAAIVAAFVVGLDGIRLVALTAAMELVACLVAVPRLIADQAFGRPDFSRSPEFIRYGLVTLPAAYMAWLVLFLDRLTVVHFVGMAEAGYVMLAATLAWALLRVVSNPVTYQFNHDAAAATNASAAANSSDRDAAKRAYDAAIASILIYCVPLLVGSAVVAPELIAVFADAKFAPAAPLLALFLLAFSLQVAGMINDLYLRIVTESKSSLVSNAVSLLVLIPGNLILVPRWSFVGAAFATVVGYLAAWAYSMLACLKAGIDGQIAGVLWRTLLAAGTMAAVCSLIRYLLPGPDVVKLSAMVLGGATTYVLVALLPKVGFLRNRIVADLMSTRLPSNWQIMIGRALS